MHAWRCTIVDGVVGVGGVVTGAGGRVELNRIEAAASIASVEVRAWAIVVQDGRRADRGCYS